MRLLRALFGPRHKPTYADLHCPDCHHFIHRPLRCAWIDGVGKSARHCPCPVQPE
jgi:hypothetical protein